MNEVQVCLVCRHREPDHAFRHHVHCNIEVGRGRENRRKGKKQAKTQNQSLTKEQNRAKCLNRSYLCKSIIGLKKKKSQGKQSKAVAASVCC